MVYVAISDFDPGKICVVISCFYMLVSAVRLKIGQPDNQTNTSTTLVLPSLRFAKDSFGLQFDIFSSSSTNVGKKF